MSMKLLHVLLLLHVTCVRSQGACNDTDGMVYQSGEIFPKDCNNCTCINGKIACTEKACPCIDIDGMVYQPGERFPKDCNKCRCINGQIACTKKACQPKPGKCPAVNIPGICVDLCSNDFDCNGTDKCCRNGCGNVCTNMTGCVVGITTYIEGQIIPDHQTCKVCVCTGGIIRCGDQKCHDVKCKYPIRKDGKCCPICRCKKGDKRRGERKLKGGKQYPK